MFYCFGCGAGGNAATFLMKYENYSFREALETLADRAGIKLPEVNYGEEARKKEEKRQQLRAVNKEAAKIGNAAFLKPPILTSPDKTFPPLMIYFSI